MPDLIARMETMLFDYETTYRTDYRGGDIKPPVVTVYKKKPSCYRIRPPPLKDVHTLSEWKSTAIPFDLVFKPRPIIDTSPMNIQKPYEETKDLDREKAIKTRPRLVMTPAVSMDDIKNPEARRILLEDMYTSDMTRGTREALTEYFTVKAPFPGTSAPADPIKIPKLQPPYVSPEWRMDSVSWDNKQLRAHCDPTKEFWIAQKVPPCSACEVSEKVNAHRRRLCQMKTENL